jgi:replicative DNA helicase
MKTKENVVGTGFAQLDKLLGGGIRKGELTILGARPAQGKTALALQIASCVVLNAGESVLFFSSQLSRHTVMQRLIAYRANINPADVISGFFDRGKWPALTDAAARFADAPLYIVDGHNPSAHYVREITEGLVKMLRKEKKRLGLVIIDQLHLRRDSSIRRDRVCEILGALKRLATDFNAAVLLLSQLPFRPERNIRDRTPGLGDLERAGVTDHFDSAILLYRQCVYRRCDESLKTHARLFVARRPIRSFRQCDIRFYPETSIFSDEGKKTC